MNVSNLRANLTLTIFLLSHGERNKIATTVENNVSGFGYEEINVRNEPKHRKFRASLMVGHFEVKQANPSAEFSVQILLINLEPN